METEVRTNDDETQRRRVFFSYLQEREDQLRRSGRRFVHYTSASVAQSIIQKREVWLRNARYMNDSSEVEHGLDLIATAWSTDAGKRMRGFLDGIFPGFSGEFSSSYFRISDSAALKQTYLTCLSEHHDHEDSTGRLSMWRAYGPTSGVALVFRPDIFISTTNSNLTAFTSPVLYAQGEAYYDRFASFVDSVTAKGDYLLGIGREQVRQDLLNAFLFAALSTKHPSFSEELEWRITHNPTLHPSHLIVKAIEICRGEPQVVYKLKLANSEADRISGLEVKEILDSIIVGPTPNPTAIQEAFISLLESAGHDDPAGSVRISETPLR